MKNLIRNQNLLAVVVVGLFAILAPLWVATFPLDQGDSLAAVGSVVVVPKIQVIAPTSAKIVEGSLVTVSWKPYKGTGFDSYVVRLGNTLTGGMGYELNAFSTSTSIAIKITPDVIPSYISSARKNGLLSPDKTEAQVRKSFYLTISAWKPDADIARGKSRTFEVVSFDNTIPQISSINNSVDVTGNFDIRGKNFGNKVNATLFTYDCSFNEGMEYICKESPFVTISGITTTANGTAINIPVTNTKNPSQDLSKYVNSNNLFLRISRADNNTSFDTWVSITENLVADRIQILDKNILTRTYDKTTQKESLTGNYVVNLVSEKNSQTEIPKIGAFYVYAREVGSGKYDRISPDSVTYNKPHVIETNNSYIIPKGGNAVFAIKATFNPLKMFAGEYETYVGGVSFTDGSSYVNQNVSETPVVPNNISNKIILIGEKSPFITDNRVESNQDGTTKNVSLIGVRFDPVVDVYFDGVYAYSASTTGKVLTIPSSAFPRSKDGSPTYRSNIQIENKGYGLSNNVTVELKSTMPTVTSPVSSAPVPSPFLKILGTSILGWLGIWN